MKRLGYGLLAAAVFCLLACSPALAAEDGGIAGTVDTLIRGNTGYGSAIEETDLGDVAADALAAVSGADAAIVNGGELRANLQAGPRTHSDFEAVFAENRTLAVADVTVEQLWSILEYGVSFAVLGENLKIDEERSAFDGFPQVSGLWFQYDLSAPVGERVTHVELDDGRALARDDRETHLTLCATEYMLSGGYGYESVKYERLDLGLADALADYAGSAVVTQPSGSRIRTIGSYDKPLISRVTVFLVALVACVIALCVGKVKDSLKVENEM